MSLIKENGIMSERDYSAFKEKSIRTKFIWQMFAAIGSATFFGLLMETASSMMAASSAAAAQASGVVLAAGTNTSILTALTGALISPVGIGFILVGAACVYAAQRFYFESMTLDQDFNAKKIAIASADPQRLQAMMQAVNTPTHEKPSHGTPGVASHAHEQETKWTDKHASRKDADAAVQKQPVENWTDEVRQSEQQTSRTIH